ncbi:MAG: hypothetical protein ACRDCT_28605, partial [Shewanella sp.]
MNNLGMARPDMYRGGPGMCPPDFKPPAETQMPPAPSNPKKRRKTAANAANNAIQPTPPPTPADLLPPPLTGYGDTIVASNPFDDTPTQSSMNMPHMGHMGMNPHHHHMNPHHMGPHHPGPMRGMNPMMMNQMNNPGMVPGPHMGMNHHMNNRGNMSPMAPMGGPMSPMAGMNPNLSPMGLQHGMNHGMNQMGPGRPMSNSPMPIGNSPMHSPLANGPMNPGNMPPVNRMNGGPMNPSQQSPHHPQMGNPGPNMMNNNLTPVNNNNNSPNPAMQGGNPMNNLPGNGLNPNQMPVSSSGGPTMNNVNSINTSNMNQNNQHPHGPMGPMMNMMQNNPGQMNMVPGPGQGPPMGMYGGPKPMPVSAGKVYPADTPMVFNPQNPNAPPIYPCGVCHKEVHDNDQGLLCESGCNFWF